MKDLEANKDDLAKMVSTSFGARVRILRKSKGLSIEELAGRSRLSPSQVSDIERGKVKNITFLSVLLLGYGLGFRTFYLIKPVMKELYTTLKKLDKPD